jgi:hypothetical protein
MGQRGSVLAECFGVLLLLVRTALSAGAPRFVLSDHAGFC